MNEENSTIKTQVLSGRSKKTADVDEVYLWYYLREIKETRGGFDGRLVHGTYCAFALNNQLIERGVVRYGLRVGEWRYWYSDGRLKEVIHWRRGIKHGPYQLYDDMGRLIARGRFKENFLHGRFKTYDLFGKVTDKKRYKVGREVRRPVSPRSIVVENSSTARPRKKIENTKSESLKSDTLSKRKVIRSPRRKLKKRTTNDGKNQ